MPGDVFSIQVRDYKGHTHGLKINADPDRCPICRNGIKPLCSYNFLNQADRQRWIERLCRCPIDKCQRLFIARYHQDYNDSSFFVFNTCVPAELTNCTFPDAIKTISPDFCAIYNEAHKAEQLRLKLVCGPGYRKALEFLVKDYVVMLHPAEAAKIKKMNLGNCITDFVTSDKVKHVASRAVWLGNDETHYERKWETKDLQDLKALITLTVQWIDMEELTKATLKDMPGTQVPER